MVKQNAAQRAASDGQQLIERMQAWILGYMSMSADDALVLALWAVHTWVFESFDATPYLAITASVPGAGKTRLAELLSFLSRASEMAGSMTPAATYRRLEEYNGRLTLIFDEAEKYGASAAGLQRSVMNTGYRRGQSVIIAVGQGTKSYPVYCPKCFVLIGDVNATLRDRCVVVTLERGRPSREYVWGDAEAEASELRTEMLAVLRWDSESRACKLPMSLVRPEHLETREREIWTAIFSVASALGLDERMMGRVVRQSADLVAAKTAPRRRMDRTESEADAAKVRYAERARLDAARCFARGESVLFSAALVERMKELADGPWRTYRGAGLDERMLAGLLSVSGIVSKTRRMPGGGRAGTTAKGYTAASFVVPTESK